MSDDAPISVRAFLRDLRWTLPVSVAAMLLLWLLDVGGMRDLMLIEALLVVVGFFVVLGPLQWLLWERLGRREPAARKFFGGSLVWAVVSLATILLILNALGVE